MKTVKARKLTKLQAAIARIDELENEQSNLVISKRGLVELVAELIAVIQTQTSAAASYPFRTLGVILKDASGKSIGYWEMNINKGDQVTATVDHLGDIQIQTSNIAR